jgi:hypothetical protein
MAHYRVNNSSPLVSVLSQMNPVHIIKLPKVSLQKILSGFPRCKKNTAIHGCKDHVQGNIPCFLLRAALSHMELSPSCAAT